MVDIQKRRKRNLEAYHRNKPPRKQSEADFSQYNYRTVERSWRTAVSDQKRPEYRTPEPNSPLIKDLLDGKTLLVDYEMPYAGKQHPFRTLYGYFDRRGKRLRIHIVDDIQKEKFRILLMWVED